MIALQRRSRCGALILPVALGVPSLALAVSGASEPLHVRISLTGAPVSLDDSSTRCEGGNWTASWEGDVPAEGGTIQEMLTSYTSFASSHDENALPPPLQIQAAPVTCHDTIDGTVQTKANLVPTRGRVEASLSLESRSFEFSASDIGICRMNVAGSAPMEVPGAMLMINSSYLNPFSPALRFSEDELRDGFQKTFNVGGTVIGVSPMCMGNQLVSGSVTLSYRAGGIPDVELLGCPYVAAGQPIEVHAKGQPSPGTYRFSAGSGAVRVSSSGDSARYVSQEPLATTLRVDYDARGGSADDSLEAMFIRAERPAPAADFIRYNRYDDFGQILPLVRQLPMQFLPQGAHLRLRAELSDPTVAGVNFGSGGLEVGASGEGRTTIRLTTECGSPVGNALTIEVMPCSDEATEHATSEHRRVTTRIREISNRMIQELSTDDFTQASDQIGEHTKEMAIKLGEAIIGALTLKEAGAAKDVLAAEQTLRNAKNLEVVGTAWDSYNNVMDASAGEWNKVGLGLGTQLSSVLANSLPKLQLDKVGFIKTMIEASMASQQMGKDLGSLLAVAQAVEELEKFLKEADEELNHALWLYGICKRRKDPLPEHRTKPLSLPDNLRGGIERARQNIHKFDELTDAQLQVEKQWGETLDEIATAVNSGSEERIKQVIVDKHDAIVGIETSRDNYVRRALPLLGQVDKDATGLEEMMGRLSTIRYANQ